MGSWTIGVEISGSRVDGEGLARLDAVLKREFPDSEPESALWSGWLGIRTTVTSPSPTQALEAALQAIDLAFDEADIDRARTSEVVNVTLHRVLRPERVPKDDSLPRALLRRASGSHPHEYRT
jgi:hypothetical protein